MIATKLTPTDLKPQVLHQGLDTMSSENEDVTNKKRKRKSRWTNDNVKVPVASLIGIIPPVAIKQTIPQPINAQKLGNF